MTAPTHPGDRPFLRSFVPAFAVTGALSAVVVCVAVAMAPGQVRAPLAGGAGAAAVVLSVAVAVAAHALRTARATRQRLDAATQDIGRLLQQQARTGEEARQERQRLVDELAAQRAEFTESFAAERARLEQQATRELDRLRQENARLTGELTRARRDRAAAVSATSNTAARMQALATATLADLRAMEDRHTDEDVLADLLHLDHRTAQAGRLADSIAVLTGARSGRRWARPIGMESILRGAMGRIAGYRRVRVHSASETAVAGHAAEGVMHALAEILDNAANFSPPTAEVHVYVEEVPAGVIVSVEDSGLVMGEVQLRRAERAVAGDVSELGGLTGTRLGLAVVGRLARKHGLKVSFRPSARGGTGVLVLIPQDILAGPVAAEQAPAPARPTPAEPRRTPAPADTAPVHEPAAPAEEGPAGLPKRRRGRTLAQAESARSAARTGETRPAPGADEGKIRAARFSSFRQAVRPTAKERGPETTATAPPSNPDGPDTDAPGSATPTQPPGLRSATGAAGPIPDATPDSPEHRPSGDTARSTPDAAHTGRHAERGPSTGATRSATPPVPDGEGAEHGPASGTADSAAPTQSPGPHPATSTTGPTPTTAPDSRDSHQRPSVGSTGPAGDAGPGHRGTQRPADTGVPHGSGVRQDSPGGAETAVPGGAIAPGCIPSGPPGTAAADDSSSPAVPSHPHAHPEGDTTS
ncbi:ATP-binding protein [Streptomyces sp. NPDC127190]|uniref:ATP-binding protein n=1 Tax=Streptomyces sp. NPDC127190 TaxID=3345387 RepID=UPI0036448206